jgi:hypothetical protein
MPNALPAIVLPVHDPQALHLPHLKVITPELKQLFSQAFIGISPRTEQTQPEWIEALKRDSFFNLNFNETGSMPGDHYRSVYQNAVAHCSPEQVLHLCTPDRVAFILQSDYREQFILDIQAANRETLPVLFQRTPSAWASYPKNYREIEQLAIRVCDFLFGSYLDLAWSHLVIRTDQLQPLLLQIKSHDFGLLTEVVLLLKDSLQTKDVDWLAWEDPFIFSRDLEELRAEREHSLDETHKRLRWLRPSMQILLEAVGD